MKHKLIIPVFIFAFLFTVLSVFGFHNLNVVNDHQNDNIGLVLGERGKSEEKKAEVAEIKEEKKQEGQEQKEERKEEAPRLRLENRDGQVVVKQEVRQEVQEQVRTQTQTQPSVQKPAATVQEVEVERKDVYEIQEDQNKYRIKVTTGSGDSMLLVRTDSAAKINHPLYLNPETNQLTVTTPAGERSLNYLPDAVVANIISYNVMDIVNSLDTRELQQNQKISTQVKELIELKEQEGNLVYEVAGEKRERVLGIIPITIQQKAVVSAETGELVKTVRSLRDTILDLISF